MEENDKAFEDTLICSNLATKLAHEKKKNYSTFYSNKKAKMCRGMVTSKTDQHN